MNNMMLLILTVLITRGQLLIYAYAYRVDSGVYVMIIIRTDCEANTQMAHKKLTYGKDMWSKLKSHWRVKYYSKQSRIKMVMNNICPTCFRDNADVLYYHLELKIPMHQILQHSDILKYGRLCCVPRLVNGRTTITLHEQKLKNESRI